MKKVLRITLLALAITIVGVGAYMVYSMGSAAPHLRNGNHAPNVATNVNSLKYFADNMPHPMAPVAKKDTSNNLSPDASQKAADNTSTKTSNNSSKQATPHTQPPKFSNQQVEHSVQQLDKTVQHLTSDVLAVLSL